MFKKFLVGVVAIIVVIGVGGYLVWANLDFLIKSAVEKYASAATQAQVRLAHVNLSLSTGEGSMSGLSVGNPKGFSSPQSFYLGNITLKIDTASIRGSGPIIIKDITIDQPQVTYEMLNNGSSNLSAIQKNTQAYASAMSGGSSKKAQPQAVEQPSESRKVIIENLTIKKGQVTISQAMLKDKQLSTTLGEIHLTNIGKQSNGATAAQVAEQLFGTLAEKAARAAAVTLAKEQIGGAIKGVVPASGAASVLGGQINDMLGQ